MDFRYNEHPSILIVRRSVHGLLALIAVGVFATSAALPINGTWNVLNLGSGFSPTNRHGHNPVYASLPKRAKKGHRLDNVENAEAAGSSNYVLTIPILSLAGRGLDVNLALTYNSQIWQDSGGGVIEFDPDAGWPVAGWSLGFGKIARLESNLDLCMIVDADGTRHPFAGSDQFTAGDTEFTAHTIDGTLIDYVVTMGSLLKDGMINAQATYPNGSIVIYGAPGEIGTPNVGAVYPTRITDAHGNFISITYRNGHGPMIDTVTDTLGRVITFHYDSSNRLVSIVRPGLNNVPLTAVRLHYGFRNRMDAIVFPTDGSGYWFGATDSYTSYGTIKTVRRQRSMGINAPSLDDQGSVTASGTNSYTQQYNYPASIALTTDGTLPYVPTYNTLTEQWSDMDTPPAVTTYKVTSSSSGQTIAITAPDQTVTTVTEDITGLVSSQQIRQASGSLLSGTNYTWEIGEDGSPRMKRIEVTDELGQMRAQEFSYGPTNQVSEEREFGYGGTHILRRTTTDYVSDPRYVGRHIFNLPSAREVYDDVSLSPASRTEYQYDTESLMDAPGIAQLDPAYNPYSPPTVIAGPCEEQCTQANLNKPPKCKQVCAADQTVSVFNAATAARGDLTRITRYAAAASRSGAMTEIHGYDIAGNVRTVTGSACCELVSSTYAAATQYAYPREITTGAASSTSAAHRTIQLGYDFGTGLPVSITEPNGRSQEFQYSAINLRIEHALQKTPGGAGFDYEVDTTYDDANLTRTETTIDANNNVAGQITVQLNGIGKVRRVQSFPDTGIVDVTDTKYDAKQRTWQTSRPYRAGFIPQWSRLTYDGLDRVTSRVAPDGSTTTFAFNGSQRPGDASNEAGHSVYVVDPWGRGRWTRLDALGRLVEVLEPNPNGNGTVYAPEAIVTRYSYDALDDLTAIDHVRQHAAFAFDSLGRLTGQRLPERDRTLTAAGLFSSAYGLYSDVYTYDARGNIASHTDARGVKTVYDNINDPLNRLTNIHYDVSGFGDTSNPMASTDDVSFTYTSDGDVARLESAYTAGTTFNLSYNAKSLPESAITQLTALPDYPIGVGYQYDAFDRVTDTTYPSAYAFPTNLSSGKRFYPHNVVHLDYDAGSRPKHLTVDGVDYASGISYDAASQLTSLNTGSASSLLGESYDIDELTGLLNAQQVTAPGATLLSLSYQYTRGGAVGRTGQATQMVDQLSAQKSRAYDYDALGRLSQVTLGSLSSRPPTYWTQRYQYDVYGNRVESKAFGPPPIFHCQVGKKCVPPPGPELGADHRDGIDGILYDPETNRISTAGYSYDAAGNLMRAQAASGAWQRFQYDAAGRLVQTTDDNGATIEQEIYGAGAQRIARIVGGGNVTTGNSTLYGWNGNQVITEYHSSPTSLGDKVTWAKSYVYFGDRLLSTLVASPSTVGRQLVQAATFYHPDRLGSRLTTDGAGKPLSVSDLYAFGVAPSGSTTSSDTRLFTSYDRSNVTGLDYAVNRFYDPSLGRFLQTDPLGKNTTSTMAPRNFNGYAYAGDDPNNAIDPLGLRLVLRGSYVCTGGYVDQSTYRTTCYYSEQYVDEPDGPSGQQSAGIGVAPGGGGSGTGKAPSTACGSDAGDQGRGLNDAINGINSGTVGLIASGTGAFYSAATAAPAIAVLSVPGALHVFFAGAGGFAAGSLLEKYLLPDLSNPKNAVIAAVSLGPVLGPVYYQQVTAQLQDDMTPAPDHWQGGIKVLPPPPSPFGVENTIDTHLRQILVKSCAQ